MTERKPTCRLYNQDCISGLAEHVPDGSVHLTVTSIPFEELFQYGATNECVGNNGSTVDILRGRFALNMRFVVDQLFRVTRQGCLCCIHIQQLLAYANQHGFIGRRDFRGAMVEVFSAAGFRWTGEFVIQKDPQAISNRLNLHSLQFKTGYSRDSRILAPVFNDYVLLFRKPGKPEIPCRPLHKPGVNPNGWIKQDARGYWPDWVRDAHGIWTDILEIDVIERSNAKLDGLKQDRHERHPCPLQGMVIQRLVRLFSNPISIQPDSTVLDPFMGIGSTAFFALAGESPVTKFRLEEPRNVIGFELHPNYYRASIRWADKALKQVESRPVDRPSLPGFDAADEPEEATA